MRISRLLTDDVLTDASSRTLHAQVVACCNPTPPLVRMHAHAIVEIITNACAEARERAHYDGASSAATFHPSAVEDETPTDGERVSHTRAQPDEEMAVEVDRGVLTELPRRLNVAAWACDERGASALARALVGGGDAKELEHESLAKALDVRDSFASLSLFGEFELGTRDLGEHPDSRRANDDEDEVDTNKHGMGPVAGTSGTQRASDAEKAASRKRHAKDDILRLSEMTRTGGSAKKNKKARLSGEHR